MANALHPLQHKKPWSLDPVPTAGILPNGGPPTIAQFARVYSAPLFNPQYRIPNVLETTWVTAGNTTNDKFEVEKIQIIEDWVIGAHDLQQFHAVWNLPYDPATLQADILAFMPGVAQTWIANHVAPISHHWSEFLGQYGHEVALTSRIDSSLWIDFSRIMLYLASSHLVREQRRNAGQLHGHLPPIYPNKPIYPDIGSNAYRTGGFLPDRCAKSNATGSPRTEIARLFGEIKPSYKFHSSWKALAQLGRLANRRVVEEYKKVLAQVLFYMTHLGQARPGGPATRYGYVLTDEEVVLLRRVPGRGNRHVQVSDGFPLRGPYGQNQLSGMQALIYIHLLAAVDGAEPQGYLAPV